MFQSTYYIDKSSNTFADNLAAFGLAFVLAGIADKRATIRLEDQGGVFALVCEPALRREWVEQCRFFTGAPFLVTYDNKTQSKMIKGTSLAANDLPQQGGDLVTDYQAEKENNATYFAWLKTLSAEDRRKVMRGELRTADGAPAGPSAPHRDWDLFRAVNPAALQSYNALLAEWWRGQGVFPDLLKILLQMTARTPNDLEEAERVWLKACKDHGLGKPKDATASQLLNPAQGKGVNNTKAEWRDPNNIKGFWLLEWLKLVGLRYGGITRLVRNSKDRKTYALVPVRLDWGRHVDVMAKFQRAMVGSASAVQLDILAALRYTQALLEHYEAARGEDLEAELFGHSAADLVGGMQMAFYKSLGNAIATMNIASINLPRWVKPHDHDELSQLHAALDEHLAIVRNLDETRGDQFELLSRYRDFLSANDLKPFFDFTTAYSGFIISQRESGKYVRQFSTTTLEVLFMNSNERVLSRIVQSEGFRNIAYAIRQATITAQYRKAKKDKFKLRYEVHYGLGQQLARKANYRNDFVAELTDFLRQYNAENSQKLEDLSKRYGEVLPAEIRRLMRRNVKVTDIDDIVRLIDEYRDPRLICNMLVAYGYAREPYEGQDEEKPAGDDLELPEAAGDDAGTGEE
ncbi:MAG: hypothetical protein M1546_05070 [Chloroflexi bacterium]|nr:hypothetical protein [Chloroflexota bacterium]